MVNLLIGHRGTGKTKLLERIVEDFQSCGKPVAVFDLDREIEKLTGREVSQIFQEDGEQAFRKAEEETLGWLLNHLDTSSAAEVFVALGAGFQGNILENLNVVWVGRSTDKLGRVFFDRPRLDPEKSSWQEYMERYELRNNLYTSKARDILLMEEGFDSQNLYEPVFWGLRNCSFSNMGITLLPKLAADQESTNVYLQRKLQQGAAFIELRDDLLREEQIQWAIQAVGKEKIIYSRRKPGAIAPSDLKTDWALELGQPKQHFAIVSSHHQEPPQVEFECIEKYSPLVNDWQGLIHGHQWWCENPNNRCFLPRSSDGRWAWYRLMHKEIFPVNFFRDGQGSAEDQPTWAQTVIAQNKFINGFAAILGDPVVQSLTPAEHYEFFNKLGLNILRIKVSRDELSKDVLEFLKKLGLRAAAVTSPLKEKIFELCDDVTANASDLKSCNTLFVSKSKSAIGENTDVVGLKSLLSDFSNEKGLVVWGGGGTLSTVQSQLPAASLYSQRKSEPRQGHKEVADPHTLVWAVGRKSLLSETWPPSQWRPKRVVDLNYSEDSPGREYAMKIGAEYLSGMAMFREQAAAQREFWLTSFSS